MWPRFSEKLLEQISSGEFKGGNTLNLSDSKTIGYKQIQALVETLNKNPKITFVSLANTNLNNECAELLSQCKYVKELDLNENQISDKGAQFLAQSSVLRKLCLNLNFINDVGAKALSENKSIAELEIEDNGISDEGAKYFLKNTTLKTLSIIGNRDITEKTHKLLQDDLAKRNKKDAVEMKDGAAIEESKKSIFQI